MPLPTTPDLRTNLATWAVPACKLPSVASAMVELLPREAFDPYFQGQGLATAYFDTRSGDLRKARANKDKYITLRVRCYRPHEGEEVYALSAKTESQKFRAEIDHDTAGAMLSGKDSFQLVAGILPGDLLARLIDVSKERGLYPAVQISCHRYAVEDEHDRLTLDTNVCSDLGKVLTYSVLEFKSTKTKPPPDSINNINLHTIKLSKFLWATCP